LFLRRDRYGRFFSALVYIPRERFNTDVRLRIESMLREALHGEHVDSSVVLGESPLAQLHLIVRPTAGEVVDVDTAELERGLAHVLRNWQDDLRELLIARHGEAEGLRLASTYGRALPAGYIEDMSPELAANDVEQLAALAGPEDLRLSLRSTPRDGGASLRLKLYRQHDDIPLSDVLPLMESMGLRVISEHPYRLQAAMPGGGGQPIYIQDFEVEAPADSVDAGALAQAFEQAFVATWSGRAENDGFNRLVLAAALDWRQVALLRGYRKYLLQTGVPFPQGAVEQTLARGPRAFGPGAAGRAAAPAGARRRGHGAHPAGGGGRRRRGARCAGRRGTRGTVAPAGRGRQPGRRPHPAQLHRRDRRDPAHQL